MATPILDAQSVTKQFGSGSTQVTAVHDVSLSVAPGELILIMGPSGSGKTTLLLMLGALLKPSGGEIVLDGLAISALAERQLPEVRLQHIGFVFQDFNLLSALSALENVALVATLAGKSRTEAKSLATEVLTSLDMGARLGFLPEKLSGGEKQRVAIARALVNDPALILADEPTANLDSKIGHDIMRRLQQIAHERGRSVVVVTHDQRIVPFADRVVWIEDGTLKEYAAMQIDPVCKMAVEQDRGVVATWEGHDLVFCSRGCRDEYLAAPREFAQAK